MKKCKVCKNKFKEYYNSTQSVCGWKCAIEQAKKNKLKKDKKELSVLKKRISIKKESLKTKSDYSKELQKLVNTFVRLRDKNKPCISCNKQLNRKYDAGHYRSVGSCPELRFEVKNIHAQCVYCNRHLHGNLINYRIGLIKRFGSKYVDYLEQNHAPKHYSIEELKELKIKYKQKIKQL